MNIIKREMKDIRKSTIFWSIGMIFMIIGGMGKYSAYSGSGQSINEIMSKIPVTLKTILGFGDFDLTKASGFYGMLFLYLVIMATIHAVTLGSDLISKEERDKTSEFLMVKPVSRSKIISAKIFAGLLNVLILNIVTFCFSLVIVGKYSNGEPILGEIQILMVAMLILQLIYFFIGTAIASFSKNPRKSASIATTTLLITFMFSVLSDMSGKLGFLKYFSPFKYFDASKLLNANGFEPLAVIMWLVFVFVLVCVTYICFEKRDLHV